MIKTRKLQGETTKATRVEAAAAAAAAAGDTSDQSDNSLSIQLRFNSFVCCSQLPIDSNLQKLPLLTHLPISFSHFAHLLQRKEAK